MNNAIYPQIKNSIKTLVLSAAVLILFFATSCGEDDSELVKEGGAFKISELAGNWEATSAFFSSDANTNVSVDIIADGGFVSLTVQSTGTCTFTINPVDHEAYTVSGEMFWELYEGEYYFAIAWDDYPGDWASYGATLTDTTFGMNGGPDTGEYDFDNDGTSESARIGFAFIRV
jgi:hypothetical protein